MMYGRHHTIGLVCENRKDFWLKLLQVNIEGSEPSIRMRNSILAKEVTSWRRGKADDDEEEEGEEEEEEEDDEDDDSAAGDGRTVVALVDEDV